MSRDVLSPRGLSALDAFVTHNTTFAFDYDGTLAPIVSDPLQAFMTPRTRELVTKLASKHTTLLITGRAVKDARAFTLKIPFKLVIGSHGAEWSDGSHPVTPLPASWRAAFGAQVTAYSGVRYEDKGQSVAVHVRDVASREDRRALSALVQAQTQLRLVPGKEVYNLIPKRAMNKGQALSRARKDLGLERVVFFGDDVTDEDVFERHDTWLMGVRIGVRRSSHARWHTKTQSDIDRVLAHLLQDRDTAKSRATRRLSCR
jgi:trehalose 6-phosphate phosphatase